MLRLLLCVLLLKSVSWAQENDILGYEIENSKTVDNHTPSPTTAAKKKKSSKDGERDKEREADANANAANTNKTDKNDPNAKTDVAKTQVPGTGNLKMEDYFQTWNARKLRQGIGFSPLLNLAQYDRWLSPKWGFFVGFRYQKTVDSFTETKTTAYNPTGLSLTDTTSYTGSRNPTSIALMLGVKNRIWQNDFLQINWGPLLLYTHGTSVNYSMGTRTRTVANVNNPNDFSVTESGVGSTSVGVDPTYSVGIKIGSEFYVKWFPNLSLCADVVVLNQLPLKGTQETNTSSRSYNVVAGVTQSPTSETYNTSRIYNDYGGGASTNQVGASYFNLLGANWSIKYVW